MRKVAIASKELVNDCVLYAVLLAESVARQLFLGAVTGSENPGAGNSDVTSDTQTVMAGMPVTTSPCYTATTGSAGEQRDVLAVTRVAAKQQKAAMAESERQALNKVALSAVPSLCQLQLVPREGLTKACLEWHVNKTKAASLLEEAELHVRWLRLLSGAANGKPMPTAGGVVRGVSPKDAGGASVSTIVSTSTAGGVVVGGGVSPERVGGASVCMGGMACLLQEVMLCCQGNRPLWEVVTRLQAGSLVVHCPLLGWCV